MDQPARQTPSGNIKPRPERLVDNIISGEYKTREGAAIAAGYSPTSARHGLAKKILESEAVQVYLKKIDKVSREKYHSSIQDSVMNTYFEGLKATKLFGKDGIEHPDWLARKSFADKFAEFFGWSTPFGSPNLHPQGNQQFNFFMFSKEEKRDFNSSFEGFLRQFYANSPGV